MNHYERLAACAPVNKAAALATHGKGSGELTYEQKKENLTARLNQLEQMILRLPRGAERKALGVAKLAIQNQLTELKATRPKTDQDYSQHFLAAAREILPPSLFKIIGNEAYARNMAEQARN